MSDLVKRLREFTVTGNGPTILESEAADRIEELERELRGERNERREEGFYQVRELERQLTAMTENADRLAEHLTEVYRDFGINGCDEISFLGVHEALAAHRKLREEK